MQFIDRLVEQVAALPGVTRAATAMPMPLAGHPDRHVVRDRRPALALDRAAASEMAIVSSGYFATMRAALVAGRDFAEFDDGRHPRVAIVNQAFADKFFPGQSPLGLRIQPGATGPYDEESPLRGIVGVVGNVRHSPLALGPEPIFYLPFRQIPWGASIVVRSELSPASLLPALRAATSALEGRAAVHDLHGFDELLARGVAGPQLVVLLIGSFAATALALTTTGLYGLLAYSVQQRTREIGVRMALGAQRSAIVSMVTGEAFILVAAGLVLGGSGTLAECAVAEPVAIPGTAADSDARRRVRDRSADGRGLGVDSGAQGRRRRTDADLAQRVAGRRAASMEAMPIASIGIIVSLSRVEVRRVDQRAPLRPGT